MSWGALLVTAFALCVGAAAAGAQPRPLEIKIACKPSCAVEAEPPVGHPVIIRVEAFATNPRLLVHGRDCPLPCQTSWPGAPALRIRSGAPGAQLTFAIAGGPPVGAVAAVRDSKILLDLFGDLLRLFSEQHTKVFGPDVFKVPIRLEARVVGGDPVEPSPSSASLELALDHYFDDVVLLQGPSLTCTAIAVGERYLLTAGHCASASAVRVQRAVGREESIAILRATRHPQPELDVAVLRVERDLRLPIRARATQPADASAAGLVKLVGYGTNDRAGERGSGTKRQATISVGDWHCTAARARRTSCLPGYEIVISAPSSDTCTGDSGGPALEWVGQRWRLAGVTSRAVPTSSTTCGGGGIYTSVGAIAGWISEQVSTP